jgi:hypothetical protein
MFDISHITIAGIPLIEVISIAKLANETGIAPSTLRSRLKNGWSVETAASIPARRYTRRGASVFEIGEAV